MNFNGKFWHKPGHLGMTTAQVKEALAGAGKLDYEVVNVTEDGFDKSFAEIYAWLNDEKIIIVTNGTSISTKVYYMDEHTIRIVFDDYDFDSLNSRIVFNRVEITLLDDNTFAAAEIEGIVSATIVS